MTTAEQLAAASLAIKSISEEHGHEGALKATLRAFGIEDHEVVLEYSKAQATDTLRAAVLTGAVLDEMAALFTSGVAVGLALARQAERERDAA